MGGLRNSCCVFAVPMSGAAVRVVSHLLQDSATLPYSHRINQPKARGGFDEGNEVQGSGREGRVGAAQISA